MKSPKIICECGIEQSQLKQDERPYGMVKLKYRCTCGGSAVVLLDKGEFDSYIYDKYGNIKIKSSGRLDD